MFKPYLFALLYIVLGAVGWRAYVSIGNGSMSIGATKEAATTVWEEPGNSRQPAKAQQTEAASNAVHRWKDQHGNWQYGEIPSNESKMEKYEKELALLRKLPREALPTQAITPEESDSLLDKLPSWSEITEKLKINSKESAFTQRLTKPLESAQNIEQVLRDREKRLRELTEKQ